MRRIIKISGEIATGAFLALVAPMAFAQTTTPTTTPAVPDTGVGDGLMALAVLGVTGVVAVAAALYLARRAAAR